MATHVEGVEAAAKVPETVVCPYMGTPLRIVHSADESLWRAEGDFYFTRWFIHKRELLHCLHHVNGKAPAFSRELIQSVREVTPVVPDPITAEALEFQKAAKEFAERKLEEKNRKTREVKK